MIPETVRLRIPFYCGCEGSINCWGYARAGVSMDKEVDKGILVEDIPQEEYDKMGARQGFIVVDIPVRKLFEDSEVKVEVE